MCVYTHTLLNLKHRMDCGGILLIRNIDFTLCGGYLCLLGIFSNVPFKQLGGGLHFAAKLGLQGVLG